MGCKPGYFLHISAGIYIALFKYKIHRNCSPFICINNKLYAIDLQVINKYFNNQILPNFRDHFFIKKCKKFSNSTDIGLSVLFVTLY